MQTRLVALQKTCAHTDILILSKPADITYFSGFTFLVPSEREALLVVTATTAHLLYNSFSPTQKQSHIMYHPGCFTSDIVQVLQHIIAQNPECSSVYIDEETLFVVEKNALSTVPNLTTKPIRRQTIWDLRMLKDSQEQKALATACEYTKNVVATVLNELNIGDTEQHISQKIEVALLLQGAHPLAFPTIVAFGAHAALPHHQPTTTKLTQDMPVLIDAGGTWGGYTADMTRTLWFGPNPDPEFLAIEQVVHDAYQAVIRLLRGVDGATAKHDGNTTQPLLTAQLIDQTARGVIEKAGFGKHFIHTTGHGIGLEIHEQPSLNSRNETVIKPGMVITIEPGIYLENKFGYRYENAVLITQVGCEELTG